METSVSRPVRITRQDQADALLVAPESHGAGGSRWRRDALRRRLLAATDVGAAVVAIGIFVLPQAGAVGVAVAALVWLVVAKLLGLYDRDHRALRHLTVDELPLIISCAAISTTVTVLSLELISGSMVGLETAVAATACAVVAAGLGRGLARMIWWRTNPPEVTVVVGEGEPADAIRRKIELFSDMHFDIQREVDPTTLIRGDGAEGAIDELLAGIDRVVIASPHVDPDLIGDFAAACRVRQVKLSVVSPLRGRALPAHGVTQLADLPILEYNTWDVSRSSATIKRTSDVVLGLVALILSLPLWGLIALAIKLGDRGPIFFTQVRAGLNGRPFRIIKFRTMYFGADGDLADVVAIDRLAMPAFKLERDPRVTPVGRLLRRLSLDELPQLLNIVRGQMSIVGPRPEQTELVERYAPEHRFRLQVKPGLTGPMQIYGRGALRFDERLAVELDYVENLSFARDLRILLLTIPAVIRGTGAF